MKINISATAQRSLATTKKAITPGNLKKVLISAKEGFWLYISYFIISEILISGGKWERSVAVEIVSILTITSVYLLFTYNKPSSSYNEAIKRGFTNLVTFAILDFLAVNWLLDSNSGAIYKFWGTLTNYAVVLVFPYLLYKLKVWRGLTPPERLSQKGTSSSNL
jgi:membrane-associated HD superfamily phosphohydrolase